MKIIIFCFMMTFKLIAGETDQYLSGDVELKDAYPVLNQYYNNKINNFCTKGCEQLTCEKLSDKILSAMLRNVLDIVMRSDAIERYPDESVSAKEYREQSIYKTAGFPYPFTKLRRTINVGGVYVSTDKFGHLGLIGRNYYRYYLKRLQKENNPQAAEKATVIKGIKNELNILGYYYNGVLSFGDLEANYQGLRLAISLCRGENPYFVKRDNAWVRNFKREFDIREYINPKMDESYNHSFRKPRLWKKVKPILARTYCSLKLNPVYIERIRFYNSVVRPNINDNYIKEYFSSKPKFDRALESPDDLCH